MFFLWRFCGYRGGNGPVTLYDIRGQEVPADKFTKSFRHSQKFKSGGTKCTIRRIAAV